MTNLRRHPATDPPPLRIGCVSYLNAKPLIHGLDELGSAEVTYAVPSRLIDLLETGEVEVALCPVIDYFRSRQRLVVLPVGGIGCDGPTLTVRLFSRVEVERIDRVFADTDSHTSVALLRTLMRGRYRRDPELIDLPRGDAETMPADDRRDAVLVIGDKVVAAGSPYRDYPHQLDLGEAWKAWTGLPFVFAVWMARPDAPLARAADLLDRVRRANAPRLAVLAQGYAAEHGWDVPTAEHYLARTLRYAIGPRELEAIRRFGALAASAGVIDAARPLALEPATALNPYADAAPAVPRPVTAAPTP